MYHTETMTTSPTSNGETGDLRASVVDPWELPDLKIETVKWKELTARGRARRVVWDHCLKPALLVGLLYMFVCSLSFLSSAFRLLGGRAAGKAFAESQILSNPIAGLMVGILVTVLVQSSSTSTSIVISMVGANVMKIKSAIFVIMGANIGTTVTNTIVSMGQAGNRNEFRRAFGAATVHDMFNWLSVIVILPLEAIFGGLYLFTKWIIDSSNFQTNEDGDVEILKVITKPFTSLVVQIDKKIITAISLQEEIAPNATILKRWCEKPDYVASVDPLTNLTSVAFQGEWTRCSNLFALSDLSDAVAGAILLVLALVILCLCLFFIVKLLHSILKGTIAKGIRKVINMDIPHAGWLTGYIAMLFGAVATVVVQSSSIFTSAVTPLVGVGLIKLERMYPLTLGSNIGTTATGVLAALATEGDGLARSMQVAMVHFFFNVSGILMWYPLPFLRKAPISAAKYLGNTTADYRWFALFYLVVMFFLLPAAVFGLSLAGWYVLLAVAAPVVLLIIFASIVNILQSKRPNWLPERLRSWQWLPEFLRSWNPLDRVITKILCCKRFLTKKVDEKRSPVSSPTINVEAQAAEMSTSNVECGMLNGGRPCTDQSPFDIPHSPTTNMEAQAEMSHL